VRGDIDAAGNAVIVGGRFSNFIITLWERVHLGWSAMPGISMM
jgi:hypothetical protein